MDAEVLGIILSSTLLATIITSFISFIRDHKKDYIDNVIRERKEWRDYIREFAERVKESNHINDVSALLQLLKVRINPYGMVSNNILYDPYLWSLINSIDVDNDDGEYLNEIKSKTLSLLSCLLKYDWERSKAEIKGDSQRNLLFFSLSLSFLLFSFKHFLIFSGDINIFYNFSVIFFFSSFINISVLEQAGLGNISRNRNVTLIIISLVISVLYISLYLLCVTQKPDFFDIIVMINPITTFCYSIIFRYINHKNSLGKIVSAVIKTNCLKRTEVEKLKWEKYLNKPKQKELWPDEQ